MNNILLLGNIKQYDALRQLGPDETSFQRGLVHIQEVGQLREWLEASGGGALVVWASPQHLLAEMLQEGLDSVEVLNSWVQDFSALPELVLEYRDRLILIASTQLHEQAVHEADFPAELLSGRAGNETLVEEVLARHLVSETPEANRLNTELLGLSIPVDEMLPPAGKLNEVLVARYRTTYEQAERLASLEEALKDKAQALEEAQAGLERLQELETENELLSLQLLQVQEELEQVFNAKEEFERQHGKLAKVKQDLEAQLQAAAQQRQALEAELSHAKNQLGRLNQELERTRKEQEARQHQLLSEKQDLEAQLQAVAQQRQALENDLATTKQRLHEQAQEFSGNRQRLDELVSENELLILQLQQVQEELEHYFALYQKLEKMRGAMPNLTYAEGIRLLSSHIKNGDETHDLLLEGLEQGEQRWQAINIKLLLRDGAPGLEIRAATENIQVPITGYRDTGSDEYSGYMVIIPDQPEGAALLDSLSDQDQDRLRSILELIERSAMRNLISLPEGAGTVIHRLLAKRACQLRERMLDRSSLSFSSHDLIEYYAIPGWEHLAFELKDVRLGGRYLPRVRFKLAAKAVKEEGFTDYGALEFRDHGEGGHPLECWPVPFEDDYGACLHLDYLSDLDEEQRQAWALLTAEDRELIDALLARLPMLVGSIDVEVVGMERPLDDWLALIEQMQEKRPSLGMDGDLE